ncbi:NAD(P)-binding domain-containing protein [Fischerella thermalis]|uniref:NAD(P)-binding domain-containing protein n=1 Tax=Fischerella thermalis TaxID=372787 RepID=UPI0021556E9F|nr:NAD(P)-binding domain-containing protein [Fischerella thermalis]
MELGLIGLGRMGANMARRLTQAGHKAIFTEAWRNEKGWMSLPLRSCVHYFATFQEIMAIAGLTKSFAMS